MESSTYQPDGEEFVLPFPEGNLVGIVSDDLVSIGPDVNSTAAFAEITHTELTKFDKAPMSGILGMGFNTTSID